MNKLVELNSMVQGFVWGPIMLLLMVGTGVYITFRTKFFTIRKIAYIFKETIFKAFSDKGDGEGEITPFQAVSTALAATLGTGNIAGVATAIASGGPGAIFWMWVSGFFGMATKFSEVVLSIHYREKTEDGRFVGGPMYYIKNGLNSKWLAILFATFTFFAAMGTGNMVQSNSVAESLLLTFNIPKIVTGAVLTVLVALVLFGGLERIANVTEALVPIMSIFYIVASLIIVVSNIGELPNVFKLIFQSAFSPTAAAGGFLGATVSQAVRLGVSRGVFSNEAGLGSAPIAHAAATTDHPVKQGLWGVFEVFLSTMVICTMTAFAIIVSGKWDSGATSSTLTTMAFQTALPRTGGYIVSLSILFFALSTLLSWSYYGERALEFLAGPKSIKFYRILWIPLVFIGSIAKVELLWDVSDSLNGLMAIPNLIGVLGLSGVVIKLTKDYFEEIKKNG